MKLDKLELHPSLVRNAIFLGRRKNNMYVNKIDFTPQFYHCLAELSAKELNKSDSDETNLMVGAYNGLMIEVKACIVKGEDETSSTPNI